MAKLLLSIFILFFIKIASAEECKSIVNIGIGGEEKSIEYIVELRQGKTPGSKLINAVETQGKIGTLENICMNQEYFIAFQRIEDKKYNKKIYYKTEYFMFRKPGILNMKVTMNKLVRDRDQQKVERIDKL